jgi:hypothetical protein
MLTRTMSKRGPRIIKGIAYNCLNKSKVLPPKIPIDTFRKAKREEWYKDPNIRLNTNYDTVDLSGKPIFFEHDSSKQIGSIIGSWINGDSIEIIASIEDLNTCSLIDDKKLGSLSIGYDIKWNYKKDIKEVSLVSEPFFDGCNLSVAASKNFKDNKKTNLLNDSEQIYTVGRVFLMATNNVQPGGSGESTSTQSTQQQQAQPTKSDEVPQFSESDLSTVPPEVAKKLITALQNKMAEADGYKAMADEFRKTKTSEVVGLSEKYGQISGEQLTEQEIESLKDIFTDVGGPKSALMRRMLVKLLETGQQQQPRTQQQKNQNNKTKEPDLDEIFQKYGGAGMKRTHDTAFENQQRPLALGASKFKPNNDSGHYQQQPVELEGKDKLLHDLLSGTGTYTGMPPKNSPDLPIVQNRNYQQQYRNIGW